MIETCLAYHALFRTNICDSTLASHFPANCFGVFTTLRRAQRLPRWPVPFPHNGIHGCIGYWDPGYREMSPSSLCDAALRVASDTVWQDERRHYFGPIETDPESFLEVDFMLLPIEPIDPVRGNFQQTGAAPQHFSNDTHGLIIQSKDGKKRATYLPGVFPETPWDKIRTSLAEKAGITLLEPFVVFAYRVIQLRKKLIGLLRDGIVCYLSIAHFSRFLLATQDPGRRYPFAYSAQCSTGNLQWDSGDDVRNLATIADLLAYNSAYPGLFRQDERSQLEAAVLQALNDQSIDPQALSFLGAHLPPGSSSLSRAFCDRLRAALPGADPEFAAPEIVIGLHQAGCTGPIVLPQLPTSPSVFGLNWHTKAQKALGIWAPPLQLEALVRECDSLLREKTSVETNYLAVAFEALATATVPGSTNDRRLFELFFELERRKAHCGVFYPFRNGVARVDITGHVHAGLLAVSPATLHSADTLPHLSSTSG